MQHFWSGRYKSVLMPLGSIRRVGGWWTQYILAMVWSNMKVIRGDFCVLLNYIKNGKNFNFPIYNHQLRFDGRVRRWWGRAMWNIVQRINQHTVTIQSHKLTFLVHQFAIYNSNSLRFQFNSMQFPTPTHNLPKCKSDARKLFLLLSLWTWPPEHCSDANDDGTDIGLVHLTKVFCMYIRAVYLSLPVVSVVVIGIGQYNKWV